jgi:hypothetical protein
MSFEGKDVHLVKHYLSEVQNLDACVKYYHQSPGLGIFLLRSAVRSPQSAKTFFAVLAPWREIWLSRGNLAAGKGCLYQAVEKRLLSLIRSHFYSPLF